ncbi:MAG TPA: prepilin-type N-terminal cleavage/methylation domain-containing protein [Candidatus Polarisedimenticolaceae bacterium]|nr:prepilin-type N-terminal cleavage/methylation domain-containing protein [Candidatus Polarisedimenticolaceae bacterium]
MRNDQRGFSLVELLVSVAVLVMALGGLASLLIQNARINKAQRMTAEVQANARNTLSMVVQALRSAGWDPTNMGVPTVNLDPDTSDDVSEIEVFANLNEDPDTDDAGEQILIRHLGSTREVVWRESSDTTQPFIVLSSNISNDADGDGTIEPMFVPDANPPTRVTVQITAQSPAPDPTSGEFIRYTVSSDVVLRKAL